MENNSITDPSVLRWIVHPIRKHHGRTALMVLVILVTMGAIWVETHEPIWVVFAALVLVLAVRQYLIPTMFVLNDTGVESRFLFYRRKKGWDELRSYYRDKNGVLLSPFPVPSRLETFRGIYLMFNDNAEPVMNKIKEYIQVSPSNG